LGGKPLVNEEGERGNVERETLGLARPVEKWPRHSLELVDQAHTLRRGGGQAVAEGRVEPRERQRGTELTELLTEPGQYRLAFLPRRVLSIPVEGRGERGVIAIRYRRLFLFESCLRPHIGSHRARRLGMLELIILRAL